MGSRLWADEKSSFLETYLLGRKSLLIDHNGEPFSITAVMSDEWFPTVHSLSKHFLSEEPNLLLSNDLDNIVNMLRSRINYSESGNTNIGFRDTE